MKTLKEGQKPETAKPWWVGTKVACRSCHSVYELEHGDQVYHKRLTWTSNARTDTFFTCPCCLSIVTVPTTEAEDRLFSQTRGHLPPEG